MKNFLFKKIGSAALAAGLLLASSAIPAAAAEQPAVSLPETEIAVDPQTGAFSFELQAVCDEPYAGMEFGVVCAQGAEITEITYDTEASVIGPKAANGLVWFGFFDGEDSFIDTTTVTIHGYCRTEADSAIAIKDVRLYTVGDSEYRSIPVESDLTVNLSADNHSADSPSAEPQETQKPDPAQSSEVSGQNVISPKTGNDINCILLMAGCTVIAAAAACALIYKKKCKNKLRGEEK